MLDVGALRLDQFVNDVLALRALGDDATGIFEFLCDAGDFALGDELVEYAVDDIGDLEWISTGDGDERV